MLRKFYQWIIDKAADPRAEWWLAFFAFADGGLFPFPPHPLLALMCLSQPKRAVRYGAITVAASMAGGSFGYAVGHFLYRTIGVDLLSLLHLTSSFPPAACYLREYGSEIIMVKGLTPIPFMLLTMTAGFIGFPYLTFFAASLVSRGVIFMGIGLLFRIFGPPIKSFIDRYFALVVGTTLLVIATGYIAISILGGGARATSQKCAHATLVLPG